MLQNRRLLDVLSGQKVDRPPVWLMRQAGRYLPEYNATRAKAGSFMQLCRNAELATEVVLQPLERFPLDAAILFSDILTVPDAMRLGLSFEQGEGPVFAHPLRDEAAIAALTVPDMADLAYVFDALKSMRQALAGRVPLIGFSGSPFTLACYMIQGRSEEGFPEVRKMMYQRPDLLKKVIDVNTAAVVAYLTEQIKAGAQALMLFDTWGGLLSAYDYERWSLLPMREIIRQLPLDASGHKVPVMLFTKGGGVWLKQIAQSGADALGIDWTVDIKWAREQVGDALCLQGNLDPQILFGRADVIDDAVDRLAEAVKGTQHIVNLGHGILPGTPIEAVSRFIERIQEKTLRPHATVQSYN